MSSVPRLLRVIVEPGEIHLELAEGEGVMQGAIRLGYTWPTLCGGNGECRVCVMDVRSGVDALSPMSDEEIAAIRLGFGGLERAGRSLRQACRARVCGEGAVVFKRGVHRAHDSSSSKARQ